MFGSDSGKAARDPQRSRLPFRRKLHRPDDCWQRCVHIRATAAI